MNLDGVGPEIILDFGFGWRSRQVFLWAPCAVSFSAHDMVEQSQDSTWRHISVDKIEYLG